MPDITNCRPYSSYCNDCTIQTRCYREQKQLELRQLTAERNRLAAHIAEQRIEQMRRTLNALGRRLGIHL